MTADSLPKQVSKRKQREEQFLGHGTGATTTLSSELVICAISQLKLALDDRRRPVFRTPSNHYSPHALGSILLLVAALEAWLNEAIWLLWLGREDLKPLAFEPVGTKYYEIPRRVAGSTIPPQTELGLVIELRHEIAHFLPRVIQQEGNVPPWFVELHRRRLFLTGSQPKADFVLSQKLACYRLAYWAWETVSAAITDFLEALGPQSDVVRWTASNFGQYRDVPSPSQLATYDAEHKLELTERESRDKGS